MKSQNDISRYIKVTSNNIKRDIIFFKVVLSIDKNF